MKARVKKPVFLKIHRTDRDTCREDRENKVPHVSSLNAGERVYIPGTDRKFTLEPGSWTVEVKAYGNAVDDANLAAAGSSQDSIIVYG
jgi:hypothetical protein